MKLEICSFSGHKIYPGRGRLYVRVDSRSFRFVNSKTESLFLQRKNPRKVHWTVVFRKMHKKGITEEVARKRTRRAVKQQRAVVGLSLEKLQEKRNQKPEERQAKRQSAIVKAKEQKKKEQADKKNKKQAAMAEQKKGSTQKQVPKSQPKGATGKR